MVWYFGSLDTSDKSGLSGQAEKDNDRKRQTFVS